MRFRSSIGVLALLAGTLAACSQATGPKFPQPEEEPEPPTEEPDQPSLVWPSHFGL